MDIIIILGGLVLILLGFWWVNTNLPGACLYLPASTSDASVNCILAVFGIGMFFSLFLPNKFIRVISFLVCLVAFIGFWLYSQFMIVPVSPEMLTTCSKIISP